MTIATLVAPSDLLLNNLFLKKREQKDKGGIRENPPREQEEKNEKHNLKQKKNLNKFNIKYKLFIYI